MHACLDGPKYNHDEWQMCCKKCQPIRNLTSLGTSQRHGASRTLLQVSDEREAECTEAWCGKCQGNIVQSESGGVENGEINITATVPASSKSATVQIFPRQPPVTNMTELDLVEDTCEGSFWLEV